MDILSKAPRQWHDIMSSLSEKSYELTFTWQDRRNPTLVAMATKKQIKPGPTLSVVYCCTKGQNQQGQCKTQSEL